MKYRIAHITDLHIPSPQVFKKGDRNIKRIVGHISWERNRKAKHLSQVLDALSADLKELKPDHICITGDQTNLGLENEFELAAQWIEQLQTALGLKDKNISVIPGNHDAYGPHFYDKIYKYWGRWIKGTNEQPCFPYLHEAGPASIIGLSSAVETLPFYANGILGRMQIAKMQEHLASVPEEKVRIVLCHHPVQDQAAVRRKALWDIGLLQEKLETGPQADIILHGHTHRIHHEFLRGPNKPVAVLGAGSASYVKNAHYQMLEIDTEDSDKNNIIIHHRKYDMTEHSFQAAGDAKLIETSAE